MLLTDLSRIWLYRLVHIDNLKYLLEHGMYHRDHVDADPNYINIGDSLLISQRNDYNVSINPPNGRLGDYVPFYFGPLSPMLFNIMTGYRGVAQRPQGEIVYICCNVRRIVDECAEWCFTDGHAKTAITSFYNDIKDIAQVDFSVVKQRYWSNTETDLDRMRKKQAEFLVKFHVPPACISNIVVYNAKANEKVASLLSDCKLRADIHTLVNFYY